MDGVLRELSDLKAMKKKNVTKKKTHSFIHSVMSCICYFEKLLTNRESEKFKIFYNI